MKPSVMNDMRKLRTLTVITWCLLLLSNARAQQEAMVSQYMFNGLFLNPAYAGSHRYTSASVLHREQWTNVAGAPSTSTLAIDGPCMNNRLGLGLTLIHDQVGVSREMQMDASVAYRMRTGKRAVIAFALKAGMGLYNARLSDLVYVDANDAVLQNDLRNSVVSKFGCGVYWSDARSYVGASVPTLVAADRSLQGGRGRVFGHYFTRHYYLNAGRVFPVHKRFDVKPNVLVKYHPQAPVEVDINLNVLYDRTIWLGVGYRTEQAVVTMLEYQLTHRLRLGYAYDLLISRLGPYSGGSHEVMLGFDLGRGSIKIKTPRYF